MRQTQTCDCFRKIKCVCCCAHASESSSKRMSLCAERTGSREHANRIGLRNLGTKRKKDRGKARRAGPRPMYENETAMRWEQGIGGVRGQVP